MAGWSKTALADAVRLAAASAVMIGAVEAAASDPGCCTDLEERIAELEATTARKANRKVSLTLSGWVNEAVFFWDDGVEQNVYVGTNDLEQSRARFVGEAKIDKDWSAGYVIELGFRGEGSRDFTQAGPVAPGSPTYFAGTRKASWFVRSKQLGKLTVGQDGMATYHLLDDADTTSTRNFSDYEAAGVAMGAFFARSNGSLVFGGQADTRWVSFMGGFNNAADAQEGRRNLVRYDSPDLNGLVLTTAWGEDDQWDVAATYRGEIGDFKLAAKAGYGESSDTAVRCNGISDKCRWAGVGGSVQHKPTGLFVYGGFGWNHIDADTFSPVVVSNADSFVYYMQAGVEQKWLPLGKTTLFAEHRLDDVGTTAVSTNSLLEFYALGAIQTLEPAAIDLYAIYRHAEGSVGIAGQPGQFDLDAFEMVISGARIQF